MLAVSAVAEFLRCTEAAHLVCTCKAFNNDPGLRDRTTAGSRRAERAQDAAAAKAAAEAKAVEREEELIQLWRELIPERADETTRALARPTLARALTLTRRESQQDEREEGITSVATAADEFESDLEAYEEQRQLTFGDFAAYVRRHY